MLGGSEWQTGRAIELYISKSNFMRHEIQGGRKYYKKYKKQAYHALTLQPQFQNYAQVNLHNIAKKVILRVIRIYVCTYIAYIVHCR